MSLAETALSLPTERRSRVALVVLAAIGAALLAIIALTRWGTPSDESAYWQAAQRLVAGEPLYDPTATLVTPYTYLYPPPLAQVLAPLTLVLSDAAFIVGWTVLLLACLWWLGGRNLFVALALIAFVPVAVELWYRNVHLILAVLIVLGLRRGGWWFAIGASIKLTPVLGIAYLASRGRYRDAAVAVGVGGALLVMSVAISPDSWRQFVEVILEPARSAGAGIVPVPFWVRLLAGAALAVAAGRTRPKLGEPLLVVAVVIANPTLYVTALSMLVAIVPLWRTRRVESDAVHGPLRRIDERTASP
jgi:hypothetical protein